MNRDLDQEKLKGESGQRGSGGGATLQRLHRAIIHEEEDGTIALEEQIHPEGKIHRV